ncbi:TerC family protein [Chelatococcus sambhunathii]|uniref:TerC family protein n=1 Tax=Chelatococcus sambhunathii TaxID=363953 RepID=A0ABU1DEW2_9HYPH|nr:TerC family protein [Chelatococcus sambhunathii]MDR4306659.1 TerC family protein [Chelatococcus sambhunathii]
MTFGSAEWLALGEIIWINALLSGDNAVVIAMACRSLPATQRKVGMVAGAGVAIGLRVLFTLIIVRLLGIPYLKIVGALALLYIAIDLVGPQGAEDEQGVKSHESLWRAIMTIAIADVVMSLDNVIAIAGVAGDHFGLLVLGLVISVPMIVAGSAVILAIMDRVPVIVWAGAALLGYVAGEMIVSDHALEDRFGAEYVHSWETTAAVTLAIVVVLVGWLMRRMRTRERVEHPSG